MNEYAHIAAVTDTNVIADFNCMAQLYANAPRAGAVANANEVMAYVYGIIL
jgi:hypothetical protein